MNTRGPVAVEPFGNRLVLERGRDSMSVQSRMQVVQMLDAATQADSLDIDSWDKLAWNILSCGATLYEQGDLDQAFQTYMLSDQALDSLEGNPMWQRIGDRGRLTVLRAAARYNVAVLFFERPDLERGDEFLTMAVDMLALVPEPDRNGEMYRSFAPTLAALRQQRSTAR
jgi:hypothetical protein